MEFKFTCIKNPTAFMGACGNTFSEIKRYEEGTACATHQEKKTPATSLDKAPGVKINLD